LPSLKEGLPYVLLEAGQAGLPVIASNVGGIPEIVEDRKTGILTKPRDVEAIHTALKNLINNKRKRQELGDNLHKKVVNSFTLKKMVEKTMEVYEKQSV
jgi:glycosyltransferase involved in cell wall biosynthesis